MGITETEPLAAHEIGKLCAASITAAQFEPIVRQAADDFYEKLLNTVQDYLCDNSQYNISSRIDVAERSAIRSAQRANVMMAQRDLLRGNLSNMLATFGNSEVLSVEQHHACTAAKAAIAEGGAA